MINSKPAPYRRLSVSNSEYIAVVLKPTLSLNTTYLKTYVTLNCSWDEFGVKAGSCPISGQVRRTTSSLWSQP